MTPKTSTRSCLAVLAAIAVLAATPAAALATPTFKTPIQQLNTLIGNINGSQVSPTLKAKLVAPLQAAKAELHKFHTTAACFRLDAFNDLVMSSYGSQGLTLGLALTWSDAAYTIQADLGCGF
jgi:hypothetical protein